MPWHYCAERRRSVKTIGDIVDVKFSPCGQEMLATLKPRRKQAHEDAEKDSDDGSRQARLQQRAPDEGHVQAQSCRLKTRLVGRPSYGGHSERAARSASMLNEQSRSSLLVDPLQHTQLLHPSGQQIRKKQKARPVSRPFFIKIYYIFTRENLVNPEH